MAETQHPGFYLDASGTLQRDRRKGGDRRKVGVAFQHDRRGLLRRKADREAYHEDAHAIEAALEEFAEEHGGHL